MKKHSIRSLQALKATGSPLTWLTCYDYSFASVIESTSLDMILVGDSGGMVVLGYENTVPVSMNEMIQMASSVRRGAPNKFIVGDLPKGSYEESDELAIRNAMRFVKESGMDAVKLEGAGRMTGRIQAIVESGIPVFGHIGLTPQSADSLGGYRVVGRTTEEKDRLLIESKKIESAGAFGVLVEAVPPTIAKELNQTLSLILMGIGAGKYVDGQLLILHDLLGLYPDFRPKFAKCFVPDIFDNCVLNRNEIKKDGLFEIVRLSIEAFIEDTKAGSFPSEEYSYRE